ncbi:N-acetylmuramoyl-L-alanine amidase [Ammoniphilus sp. YIM 78166]|uniref:N-acetylmuramoyl-L-alanine amidase n=1 Tax=Ammoniphilus sp. YIM 78166 TaxID=1644106 RepID=UPI001F108E50|nr:N-acetylmuramoyl-L-alanine amidase [Ammoniphilus sp. YIM 78166]
MASKNPIMGRSQAAASQMVSFVRGVNPNFNPEIASDFLRVGDRYGVRGDIAFCQSIHETNWFRFGGDVKPNQNNFGGIGATGGGNPGHSFATIEEGVTAQIQHLYAYATRDPLPAGEPLVSPRFHLVQRGSAPNWEDLAGKWAVPGYDPRKYSSLQAAMAAGESYGQLIIRIYQRMIQTTPAPTPAPSKDRTFRSFSIDQFQEYLQNLPTPTRPINHIQIHHTWKPRITDYTGEQTIYNMWKYHTQTNGWADIAQHFTVSPDGLIWDGRPLDQIPAGIQGHNTGGIMIEIIGNFDQGEERLEGSQLEATVHLVRLLLTRFNLQLRDIVFHREHSGKTCPGSGLSKEWFLEQVQQVEDGYPPQTPLWKKEAMDWMYEQGLLTHPMWKEKLEEPLPLWAYAIVLQRFREKIN